MHSNSSKKHLLITLFIFLYGLSVSAGTFYSYQTGNFQTTSTWTTDPSGTTLSGSAVPASGDNVVILNGRTVTMTGNSVIVASLNITSGGILDLGTTNSHNFGTVSGQGLLKLKSASFPAGTFTSFVSSSGGTIEFYDFGGAGTNLPIQTTFNNLTISNSTSSTHILNLQNPSNPTSYTINGNMIIQNTGNGSLVFSIGTSATNSISINLKGNLTNSIGSTIQPGVFNALHTLTIFGDLTNYGTIHFTNNHPTSPNYNLTSTTGAVSVTFSGLTNNTVTCNGVTNFYNLYVNKGTDQTYELLITSTAASNFNIYGPNTQATPTPKALDIANGTLRLQGNITIPSLVEVSNAPIIPSSGKLWIDGNNVSVTTSVGSALGIDLFGTFKITAGTFNSNVATGFQCEPGSFIDIQGGTVNVSNIRPKGVVSNPVSSYSQSGGIVNVNSTGGSTNGGNASFCYPYSTNSFTMTGGTINILNPTLVTGSAQGASIAIGSSSSNYSVTGGTVNVTIPGNQSFNTIITSSAPFYDLNINCASTTSNKTLIINSLSLSGPVTVNSQPLTVLNNFTINGTNAPTFNANGQDITVAGNFTIGSGATYITGANATILNKTSGTQTIALNNTSPTFNNLTINSGGTVIFTGNNPTITGNLSITSGILDDGGKSISVNGNISNSGTHLTTGVGSISLTGSVNQTISGNGSGIFGKLIVNNSIASGLTAVTLTSGISISNSLILNSNNIVDIGIYGITLLSTTASAIATSGSFSNQRMIKTTGSRSDAGLTMTFGAGTGDFIFPVGTSTKYTPVTMNLTTSGNYGTVTVRPVNSVHPNNTNAGQSLNYYWRVTSSGWTGTISASHKNYTYLTTDEQNPTVNYVPARYDASSLTWAYGIPYDATAGSGLTTIPNFNTGISFTPSISSFIDGEYTAGNLTAFGTVVIYYSRQSGNWDSFSGGFYTTWSTTSNSGPASPTLPSANSPVIIGDGVSNNHIVSIPPSAGAITTGSLTINLGSTLDLGTTSGHNFGTLIVGSGKISISSSAATAVFPAGDFSSFIGSSGGTVEYYDTGTSFILPAVSSSPTNLNLTTYYNLNINPGTGRNISLANINLTIYNNLSINGSSNTALARFPATAQTTTINGNVTVSNGDLRIRNSASETIIILGDLTIGSSAIFSVQATASALVHNLTINGNIINDGQLLMFTGASNGVCNVTFSGNANVSITGNGTATSFNRITVNKGSDQNSFLDVNTPNFNLFAPTSGATKALTIQNGTLKLNNYSSPLTLSSGTNNGSDFSIPSTGCLWVNGGTVQIIATGTNAGLLLSGKLKISSGSVNINAASSSDNYIEYSTSGTAAIDISGGTLTVGSQIRRSTSTTTGILSLTLSGTGKLVAGNWQAPFGNRGVLEILNSGSSFNMSGGTIEIARQQTSPTIASLYLNPETASVTGGLIQIGNLSTPAGQTISLNSSVSLYDLTVSTNNTPVLSLQVNPLFILNDLTIGTGSTLTTNNLNVSIGRNLSNSGSYIAGTNTTSLNSSINNQTLTGNTSFYNLTVNNTKLNGTVTLQASTAISVANSLTISSGTLNDGGNIITVSGNITNSAIHSGGGKIRLFNNNVVTQTLIGTGTYGNIDFDNTQNFTISADQTINGTVTFSNGLVTLGTYSLSMGLSSSFSGYSSSKYITTSGALSDGGITKSISSGSFNFTFPIGVPGKYTPAQFIATSNSAGGNITVKPVNIQHPATNQVPVLKSLKYFWNVSSTGFSSLTVKHFYSYLSSDVQGTEASYISAFLTSGGWTTGPISSGSVGSQIITIDGGTSNSNNGVNFISGDFTAGEVTEFPAIQTFISNVTTGNWEVAGTWNLNQIPTSGSNVVIRSGDNITVTTNSKLMNSLLLNNSSILDLGVTTGHNFGTVSGTGTLKIASSIFPGGNYSSFTNPGNGTVEYNSGSAQNLPTQTTYNNLLFSGNSIKTIGNIDITVNGDLTISAGTLQLSSSFPSKNITLYGNWTNNGSAAFTPQTGTLTFTGTNPQTLGGSVSSESFYNMTLNKSAQKVSLSLNTTISNNLVLTNGNINTGNFAIKMSKTSSQPVTGYSTSSYVEGTLEITYPASGTNITRTFPIGSASYYKPISLTGSPLSATIAGKLINSSPVSGSLVGGLVVLSSIHYYSMNFITGSLSNSTLTFPIGGEDGVNNPATLAVAYSSNNSTWANAGKSSYSGSNTNGLITSSNIFFLSGQQYVALGSIATDNSLPVVLDYSSIKLEYNKGKLSFSFATESELNVAFWELQRMSEGEAEWKTISTKKSEGTSSKRTQYHLTDLSPSDICKYKLIEYDLDGTTVEFGPYSFVRTIPSTFQVYQNYPNPFNPETVISFENVTKEFVSINIFDIKGQLIKTLVNGEFDSGFHSFRWSGKNDHNSVMASGIYIAQIQTKSSSHFIKMIMLK